MMMSEYEKRGEESHEKRLVGALSLLTAVVTMSVSLFAAEIRTEPVVSSSSLLDVFPESVVQMPAEKQGRTTLSTVYTPTGSLWAKHLKEEMVFQFEMKHTQDKHNSFNLRIGKGGQLYSLRGAFGESVPPQLVGQPWNDEVWQFVSVSDNRRFSIKDFADDEQAGKEYERRFKAFPYSKSYFLHNSGAYVPARVDSGIITLSCDVLLDKKTPGSLSVIIRAKQKAQWVSAKHLTVSASAVSLGDKVVAKVSPGSWYNVRLTFNLEGADSSKSATVTVTNPSGEETTAVAPFADSTFTTLSFLGLSAGGTKAGIINIDNLSVKRVMDTQTEWPIKEDFEGFEAGEVVPHIIGVDKTKGADAFVSDKVSASGKKSLEIHDAPGLGAPWQPMARMWIKSSIVKSIYCPMLGSQIGKDSKTYRSVNWGMVPQLKTIHRSPILYYVQTRDVGDGVIEVTYVVHNFSVDKEISFRWLNAPWGGTRISSLPFRYISTPGGELLTRSSFPGNTKGRIVTKVRNTGGWNLSCATEEADSPSLALVFGRDKHLPSEMQKKSKGEPHCQFSPSLYRDWTTITPNWKKLRENSWRNYDVAVVIPRLNLAPGVTIWYRSYLVVNRKERAIELAKSLVDKVDYGQRVFDPKTTPMVPVAIDQGKVVPAGKAKPAFKLFSKPVPGTLPLFLIAKKTTGREVITSDPYIFVKQEKLDLGVPPDHPRADYYSSFVGYSLGENDSQWKALLGYAYVEKPKTGHYARLSSVVSKGMFGKADAFNFDLWVRK